jgi:hypothetical protein
MNNPGDLTLLDSGGKDTPWGTGPVYILAAQAGCSKMLLGIVAGREIVRGVGKMRGGARHRKDP